MLSKAYKAFVSSNISSEYYYYYANNNDNYYAQCNNYYIIIHIHKSYTQTTKSLVTRQKQIDQKNSIHSIMIIIIQECIEKLI